MNPTSTENTSNCPVCCVWAKNYSFTAFNRLRCRKYLWGCRNKFCCRYCFTVHLPHVKATGALYWKGKGGLADRSKLFFSPFQTISPRVNTIIIRELGSDRFKLSSTPFHTQYVGSISVIRGWGRDDHFTIFFSTPFGFARFHPSPKTAFGKGGILVHFQIEKCKTFHIDDCWWEYSVAGQWPVVII